MSSLNISSRILGKLLSQWLVLLVMILAGVWWIADSSWATKVNYYLFDRLLPLHTRMADDRIVIIEFDQRSLNELGRWPWNRQVHADMFDQLAKQAPKAVLFDVLMTEPSNQHKDDLILADAMRNIPELAVPVLMIDNGKGSLDTIEPAIPFASSARLGHINILPDEDGVVRSVFLQQKDSAFTEWPLLTTLLTDTALKPHLNVSTQAQPVAPFMIPFNIPQGNFISFSYLDLLEGRVPTGFLTDKYVLIGATANGLGDQYPTPISKHNSLMPGIEIHANILDGLLNNVRIHTASSPTIYKMSAITPVLLFFLMLLLLRERDLMFGLLIFTSLYLAIVCFALWYRQLWLQPGSTLVGIFSAYLLWSWRRLSVFQNHVNFELDQLRKQTGHLFSLLPKSKRLSFNFQPHKLEMNIERVHQLGYFVTDSLQQLPVIVLLVNHAGEILLHNQLATEQFGSDITNKPASDLLHHFNNACSDWFLKDDFCWEQLNEKEIIDVNGQVFVIYVVRIEIHHSNTFDYLDNQALWQISLVNLTNERKAQQQRNDLMTYMSHDLRSPQVGILSLIQLYQGSQNTMSEDEFLQKISENVHSTLGSASGLLNLARAQDKSHYAMAEINFSTVLHSAVEQVWAQATAKRMTLNIDPLIDDHFDQLWLLADGDMLVRALVNLLNNAIRYSPDNTSIFVNATRADDTINCTIRDQGKGISASKLDLLNQQGQIAGVAAEKSPDSAGSFGIGLNMVKAVLEQHHARVHFESTVDVGTTVHIALPAAPDDIIELDSPDQTIEL